MANTVKLDSKIFDKNARRQIVSNLITKSARDFRVLTKERMVKGLHTGRLYSKKRGTTFRRSHRASARGQRPSPDTGTLVNAIADKSLSETHSRVFIAERTNPNSGTVASKYGEILQNKLDRPIMSNADAIQAQGKMRKDAEVAASKLI